MAAATMDLSDIVLVLGNVEGIENILGLSENRRYEFTPTEGNDGSAVNWRGGQPVKLTGPCLCFMFGQHLYSPQGWVGGSSPDSDDCDLQLAKDNRTGVSRRHFRIDISPGGRCPRLTNLSRNAIRIHGAGGTIILDQEESVDIISRVTIDLGQVLVRAWRPVLSREQERRYNTNVENFHREFMNALPKPAVASMAPTLDIRFGLNNAVYKREEEGYTGAGSFASVMKVKELRTGKSFAAKVPHYKTSDPAGKVRKRWESLTDEFQKLVKLKHAHIVQAIEILPGRNEIEPPWLIMEWVPLDLDSMSLNDHEILVLLRQVSSGLAFMHASGFAHRDLKPENILIHEHTGGFSAKIADVGMSKYNIRGKMQTYAGSIAYMAPEFWESELAYTNAVDMWSFGIIAVKLLTGWESISDGLDEVMQPSRTWHQNWIRNSIIPRLDLTPAGFEPLLRRLLSEAPGERLTASVCEEWLRTNAQELISIQVGDRCVLLAGEERRHVRSIHPTLSTTRADNNPSPRSTIPDTEPWGSPR
ncbi:Protein kinase-like domain protein [Tolypocladium capitatum]|uniref:non-specific serine/threonine protein kinase n=1 Tax=Tolypocladium capitatum TaxID=45235 RepID=A0A2K3QI01_9HYPO|nr:Protein kinase-like domain protein [Tolypocladium capitatum]